MKDQGKSPARPGFDAETSCAAGLPFPVPVQGGSEGIAVHTVHLPLPGESCPGPAPRGGPSPAALRSPLCPPPGALVFPRTGLLGAPPHFRAFQTSVPSERAQAWGGKEDMRRPVLGLPWCGGPTAPKAVVRGARGAQAGAGGLGGPGRGLGSSHTWLRPPPAAVQQVTWPLCARLCHHGETGHGTASVPRDTLIVRPSGAGFELVARAPEEGGVVTWRKKTSLAPRRGRRGKMLSRTSSARTQGGAGAGVLFGSAGWLGARTGPSGPCPCSPCGGCPLPLGGSLADQRGLPGGTRAGQSLGRCSSAT